MIPVLGPLGTPIHHPFLTTIMGCSSPLQPSGVFLTATLIVCPEHKECLRVFIDSGATDTFIDAALFLRVCGSHTSDLATHAVHWPAQ